MTEEIVQVAKDFQELSHQKKALESKLKPLKEQLLNYADSNRGEFNSMFKLAFPNGTYVLKKASTVLDGEPESKNQILELIGDVYAKTELDEKKVIANAPQDHVLLKTLDQYGLKLVLKETLAVYA